MRLIPHSAYSLKNASNRFMFVLLLLLLVSIGFGVSKHASYRLALQDRSGDRSGGSENEKVQHFEQYAGFFLSGWDEAASSRALDDLHKKLAQAKLDQYLKTSESAGSKSEGAFAIESIRLKMNPMPPSELSELLIALESSEGSFRIRNCRIERQGIDQIAFAVELVVDRWFKRQ